MIIITITTNITTSTREDGTLAIGIVAHHHPPLTSSQEEKKSDFLFVFFLSFFLSYFFQFFSTCCTRTYSHKMSNEPSHTSKSFKLREKKKENNCYNIAVKISYFLKSKNTQLHCHILNLLLRKIAY